MTGGDSPSLEPWRVLDERDVHVADPWFRLSVQRVRLPDGRTIDEFYRMTMPDYAVIVATTPDGRFVMERSYKHGPGRVLICLPAGLLGAGEEPVEGARRELLEETGYAATGWSSLGVFTANGNYGCGRAHLFRAHDATRVAEPDSGDLEDIRVELMSFDEVMTALRGGDIGLLSTAAALALATHPSLGG